MPTNFHSIFRTAVAALCMAALPLLSSAHDADSYGGMYRSRDAGATWLPADAGQYINASNALAISPADANRLLYGTDTKLLLSNNGGRDWHDQAVELISGPIYCAAFDRDGRGAFAANASGLLRSDDGVNWHSLDVPLSALPIAQVVAGRNHVLLAGNDGVYIGNASGQNWRGPAKGLPDEAISALLLADATPQPTIHAVLAGRIWRSTDGGNSWQAATGEWRDRRVDSIAADAINTQRVWAAGASRLFRSDDGGKSWQDHGQALPDPNITIRGIGVMQDGKIIVLTTHRGLLRSVDSGATWSKIESALPLHLEAGPLTQDAKDPNTLYAGFSLRPYSEAWNAAQELARQKRQASARAGYTWIALAGSAVIALGLIGFLLRKRANLRRLATLQR